MAKQEKPKKHQDLLMAALNFDEGDLAANRNRQWSARQQRLLLGWRMNFPRTTLIQGVALTVLLLFLDSSASRNSASYPINGLMLGILLTLLASFYAFWHTSSRIRHDLDGQPGVIEGQVALHTTSTNYGSDRTKQIKDCLVVNGQEFAVNRKTLHCFKNGDPYRCYYLPTDKKLVSVEWLRDDAKDETSGSTLTTTSALKEQHTAQLMQVLNFTESDLVANRTGKLSSQQIGKQVTQRSSVVVLGVALLFFGLCIFGFVASDPSLRTPVGFAVAAFILIVMIVLPVISQLSKADRTVRAGGVAVAEGRAVTVTETDDGTKNYYVEVDNHRLSVNELQCFTFKSGDPYRIYYIPGILLNRVVSAEWLVDVSPFEEKSP